MSGKSTASFIQAMICLTFLMQSDKGLLDNPVQCVSCGLSLVMIALTQVGLAYEKEVKAARDWPQHADKGDKFSGLFPDSSEKPWQCLFCVLGLFLMTLGFSATALLTVVAGALVFGVWVPAAIVAGEATVHTLLQACRGQLFRANKVGDHSWWVRGVDATIFHTLLTYPGIAFAPNVQWRLPEVLGGAYFSCGCVYTLVRCVVVLGRSARAGRGGRRVKRKGERRRELLHAMRGACRTDSSLFWAVPGQLAS